MQALAPVVAYARVQEAKHAHFIMLNIREKGIERLLVQGVLKFGREKFEPKPPTPAVKDIKTALANMGEWRSAPMDERL